MAETVGCFTKVAIRNFIITTDQGGAIWVALSAKL
jgi:hypothetical protein